MTEFTTEYYQEKYPILFKSRHDFDNFDLVFSSSLEPFTFIYNNVLLENRDHVPIIFYDAEDRQDAECLIDYLSFIFHMPAFIHTGDEKFDDYLCNLYDSSITFEEWRYFSPLESADDVIQVEEINHPILLVLYNTAMKQPEPLARCVFLYRIIECYFKINNINNRAERMSCIKQFYEKALEHYFIPINVVDKVQKSQELEKHIETITKDLIDEWKEYSEEINIRWQQEGKNLATEIYNKGRCGVAHGNEIDSLILHDYSNDYKFITEVNYFLELICRYIIEFTNPKFKNNISFEKNWTSISEHNVIEIK
jgi:hypothetical protein